MGLLRRFTVEWRMKCVWGTFLHPIVGGLYALTQKYPWHEPRTLSPSWIDLRIPFLPDSSWVYQSLFLLMPFLWFFLPSRDQVLRAFWGLTALCVSANVIFFLLPTQIQRPESHVSWAYQMLILRIDGASNSLPSLHAGLSVYCFCWLRLLLKEGVFSRRWNYAATGWLILLLLSTLTTKQHYLADIIAGAFLGLACFFLSVASTGSRLKHQSA